MYHIAHTEDKGDETLEDEDPGPAVESTNTVHLHDATGEETAKGTGGSGGREEDGHAETALVALIPHGDAVRVSFLTPHGELAGQDVLVGDTGEETTLGETQGHANTEETLEAVDGTHDHGHGGPGDHDGRNPE